MAFEFSKLLLGFPPRNPKMIFGIPAPKLFLGEAGATMNSGIPAPKRFFLGGPPQDDFWESRPETLFWVPIRVVLGPKSDQSGPQFESVWAPFRIGLGSISNRSELHAGTIWVPFWVGLGSILDRFGNESGPEARSRPEIQSNAVPRPAQ